MRLTIIVHCSFRILKDEDASETGTKLNRLKSVVDKAKKKIRKRKRRGSMESYSDGEDGAQYSMSDDQIELSDGGIGPKGYE